MIQSGWPSTRFALPADGSGVSVFEFSDDELHEITISTKTGRIRDSKRCIENYLLEVKIKEQFTCKSTIQKLAAQKFITFKL